MKVAGHISELVGGTPLVRLSTVTAGLSATVLAKVEYLSPGGSIKDRIALRMIEASAASIIRSAIRSLMDPPGLRYSTLASTVALSPAVTVLSRTSGVPPTSSEMCPATFMPASPGRLQADQGEHEDADQRDPQDGADDGPDEPRSGGRPRTEVPAGDAAEGRKGSDVDRTDPHGGRAGLHTGALARSVQGEREDRVAPEHADDQSRRTKEQRGRPVAVAVGDPVHRQGDQQAGGEHERDGQRSSDQQELGHPQHEHDEHLGAMLVAEMFIVLVLRMPEFLLIAAPLTVAFMLTAGLLIALAMNRITHGYS